MSVEQARALIDVGRWQDAKDALARPLADPQAGARPWCLLAQCELALARPLQSRDAAARALALEPDNEWAFRLLALAELGAGRKKAAQAAAQRAWALAPAAPGAVYTLVRVLLARGRWDQANDAALRGLSVDPQSPLVWEAATSVALHRDQWVLAEQRARHGLSISPQDSDLMMLLGLALQGQGRHAEAAQLYAASSRADPRDQRGRRALGQFGLRVSGRRASRVRWLLLLIPQVWVGVAIRHGVAGFRQWRARSRLPPQLRAVARREARRRGAVRWLVPAAIFAALAVLGLAAGVWTAAGLYVLVAAACAGMWAWWAPARPGDWLPALRRGLGR